MPAALSFTTFFLFLEFVVQIPTSGPLHVLFLPPQNVSRDWLSTSDFGLSVTSSERLSLSAFLFPTPTFLAHPLIHSSAPNTPSTYCGPGLALGMGNKTMNKADTVPAVMELSFYQGKQTSSNEHVVQ